MVGAVVVSPPQRRAVSSRVRSAARPAPASRAAMTKAATSGSADRRAAGSTRVGVEPSTASRSAETSSDAVSKRSRGSLARARWNTGSSRGDTGRHLRIHVCGRLRRRALGLERPTARDQLVRDDAERIAVAGRGRLLALGLLGREVARSAENGPGHRQRGEPRCTRDPEVGDSHLVVAVEEEVPRLDVAVDDAVAMGGVERSSRLLEPVERLVRLEAPPGEAGPRASRRRGAP